MQTQLKQISKHQSQGGTATASPMLCDTQWNIIHTPANGVDGYSRLSGLRFEDSDYNYKLGKTGMNMC